MSKLKVLQAGSLFYLIIFSAGCAGLVLKDKDSAGAKISKVGVRTLLGLVSIGTSEIPMARHRNAYLYTRSWEKAIEAQTTSDTILSRLGPPAQKQTRSSGGEVWVYVEDWGVTAAAYGGVASAQGHGRKTVLTFSEKNVITDFTWNSW